MTSARPADIAPQSPAPPPVPTDLKTWHRWNPVSVALIVLAWLVLHIGCLFSPGLLDDVDSIYIEIAREMLGRHDLVTPFVDGIRFFDKPPLMFWLAAGSMHLFGAHAWAARLPLALLTLALFLATYALGLRLFTELSPSTHPDRGALYSALALATSIGPFLYTRFFIPDIVLALWMTLAVHLFLIALERIDAPLSLPAPPLSRFTSQIPLASSSPRPGDESGGQTPTSQAQTSQTQARPSSRSALLPILAFAVVMALNVLTKGLIGLVFPVGFVLLYLALTRRLHLIRRLHPLAATAAFLAVAAPWHILAALRNPAIDLPPGLGLPAHGGWAWFYLYNEHIARFLSRRIPHDYGQVPVPLFWLLSVVWLFPWAAFLPAAIAQHLRDLRSQAPDAPSPAGLAQKRGALSRLRRSLRRASGAPATPRGREAALTLLLWAAIVIGFFTLSARQEYYSLPAIPALALMVGGLLARADRDGTSADRTARLSARRWSGFVLAPLGLACAAAAAYFALTAPHPAPGVDISTLLAQEASGYNLSLGHLFDLTGAAMGLFRAPLSFFALSMLAIGPGAWLLRRSGRALAANLTLVAASASLLLCIHEGLARFYPTLGSKSLADAILAEQHIRPRSGDLILIDGELTGGSTLLFYTRQTVHLVDGRINGPWYGSFWPDAPAIFETDASLHQLWSGPHRVFLLTYHPDLRTRDLGSVAPVRSLASAGGKAILTNQP